MNIFTIHMSQKETKEESRDDQETAIYFILRDTRKETILLAPGGEWDGKIKDF